jgi:hypothetical protein
VLTGAPQLTGTIVANGTDTALSAALSPPLDTLVRDQGGGMLDARQITLAIGNNSGQTITAATLALSGTVGGLPVAVSYTVPLPSSGLAAGTAGIYVVLLSNGLLPQATITCTFAAAPAATATVGVQATVQLFGAPSTTLVGSSTWLAGTFAVPTTAAALPSYPCNTVWIMADAANADNVSIGPSASNTPIVLTPGQNVSYPFTNSGMIYAVASATGNSLFWAVW